MLVGQHPGDVRQQAGPVERLDLDLDQEDELADGAHSTSTIRSGCSRSDSTLRQSAPVHRHAGAAGDEADDLVARAPACSTGPA